MSQKGLAFYQLLIILATLSVAAYLGYKYYLPKLNMVVPTPVATFGATPNSGIPIVTQPMANTVVKSPLTVQGIVPPGWMFEGVFPVKIVDSNRQLIVGGQATEEVPGSWQSNVPVNFSATLNFTTNAKSGFIILMNDNPSGDPSKSMTFEVPVGF